MTRRPAMPCSRSREPRSFHAERKRRGGKGRRKESEERVGGKGRRKGSEEGVGGRGRRKGWEELRSGKTPFRRTGNLHHSRPSVRAASVPRGSSHRRIRSRLCTRATESRRVRALLCAMESTPRP